MQIVPTKCTVPVLPSTKVIFFSPEQHQYVHHSNFQRMSFKCISSCGKLKNDGYANLWWQKIYDFHKSIKLYVIIVRLFLPLCRNCINSLGGFLPCALCDALGVEIFKTKQTNRQINKTRQTPVMNFFPLNYRKRFQVGEKKTKKKLPESSSSVKNSWSPLPGHPVRWNMFEQLMVSWHSAVGTRASINSWITFSSLAVEECSWK